MFCLMLKACTKGTLWVGEKKTKKAENAYKKDVRKNGRFASTYNLETARKKLEFVEYKYNNI